MFGKREFVFWDYFIKKNQGPAPFRRDGMASGPCRGDFNSSKDKT